MRFGARPAAPTAAGAVLLVVVVVVVALLAAGATAAETMDGARVRVTVPDTAAGVLATVKRDGQATNHTLQFEVSVIYEYEVPLSLSSAPVALYDVQPPTATFTLTRSEQVNRTRVDSDAALTPAATTPTAPANEFRTRVELVRGGNYTFAYGGAMYTLANDTIKVSLATAAWQYASSSGTSQLLLRILARSSIDLDFAGASKTNLTPDFYRYCLPPADKRQATLCVELFRPIYVDDVKVNLETVSPFLGGEVIPIDERSAYLQYMLPHGSKLYWDPNVVVLFPDGYDSGAGGGGSDDKSDSKSSSTSRLGIGLGVGLGGGLLLLLACIFVVAAIAGIALFATVGPGFYAAVRGSGSRRSLSRRSAAGGGDPLQGSASAAELMATTSPLGSTDETAV